jgi:hypothetical protein
MTERFVLRLKRTCRNCQHWNETMYGDCLEAHGPKFQQYTDADDTCSYFERGAWTKPDQRTACSICGDKIGPHRSWGRDTKNELPFLLAELRIPLCAGCGRSVFAAPSAWYKRVGTNDTPREMLSIIRKVRECHGVLQRAANGGMEHWPYQESPDGAEEAARR